MSLSATMWAWQQGQVKGSTKLVLLCFAEHYNDDHEASWPSAPAVASATGLDRKTIISCLNELREKGLIEDSGARSGRTRQVVVYRLPEVPEFRKSVREIASKQAQKRNSTENGTVPVFPSNRPVFPIKQAQKRATEPLKEPLKEPVTSEHDENSGSATIPYVENQTPEEPYQASRKPNVPGCPHQAIVDLYHEILPEFPEVRRWTGQREAHLRARWKESSKVQSLEWWREFFESVRRSPFLMGKVAGRGGAPPFRCSLAWLISPENFAKTVEGFYDP